MTYLQPRPMNLAVGKLYCFDTQAEVDDVLCYEGPRPLKVGDLAYCEHKIGNVGYQLSLVKRSANGEIRRVSGSQFAVDGSLREVGELSDDVRFDYEKGLAVAFDAGRPSQAATGDPKEQLKRVEPGDVIELAEEGKATRYAFVLNNSGSLANPRLRLAARGEDGRLERFSRILAELTGATVFADASTDRFQEGPLYVLDTLRPGTVLRFKDPLEMVVFGDVTAKGGQYALLERVTGRGNRDGARFHLLLRAPNGDLVKRVTNRWFFEDLGMSVVGIGDRGPLNLG